MHQRMLPFAILGLGLCVGCGNEVHVYHHGRQAKAKSVKMEIGRIDFIPPHVHGDRDFKGHGPRVQFRAEVSADPKSNTLGVRVFMHAEEWKDGRPEPDHTVAEGWTRWESIPAPPGLQIVGLDRRQETGFHHDYVDKDHEPDHFTFPRQALVAELIYTGDTGGEEAGTKTGVTVWFHPVRVLVVPD